METLASSYGNTSIRPARPQLHLRHNVARQLPCPDQDKATLAQARAPRQQRKIHPQLHLRRQPKVSVRTIQLFRKKRKSITYALKFSFQLQRQKSNDQSRFHNLYASRFSFSFIHEFANKNRRKRSRKRFRLSLTSASSMGSLKISDGVIHQFE